MAKAKFERNKPHLNIGTIGHIDHGKTTLTAAITKVLHDQDPEHNSFSVRPDDRQGAEEGARHRSRSRTSSTRRSTVTTRDGDCPSHADWHQEHDHRRRRWTVRSSWSPPPTARGPTREHVLLARQVGVPSIGVALNKSDMVDDEILELVELEVREPSTSTSSPATTRRSCGSPH
jgi:elongation factor Tu